MTVRLASMAENMFNAVERVDEYSHVQLEADAVLEPEVAAAGPGEDWPWRGEIVFQDVSMRYRPGLPLVLKGLNLKVDAGFKVRCLVQ